MLLKRAGSGRQQYRARLCFRRKSLWGKQHGKEERTTKEGQGSLSCCTWCPKSHSASPRRGWGAGISAYCPWGQQTLAFVCQTPLQHTFLRVSGASSTPWDNHKARDVGKDQLPFLEVSNHWKRPWCPNQ